MSDFWVRKMKTYFQRVDFDKDGVITQKDFEGMAERFVKREKLDDARGKELKTKLLQASTSVSTINEQVRPSLIVFALNSTSAQSCVDTLSKRHAAMYRSNIFSRISRKLPIFADALY